MGFKSKVLGILAAAALTLSMGAGIASAQDNAVTNLNAGTCGVSVSFNSLDGRAFFGGWKYDGTLGSYSLLPGMDGIVNYTLTVTAPSHSGTCDVNVNTDGLTMTGQSTVIRDFSVGYGADESLLPENGKNIPGLGAGSVNVPMKLESVPNDAAPGEYSGEMVWTVYGTNP